MRRNQYVQKTKKHVNRAIKVSENAQTVVYPILSSGQVRIKQNGHLTWRNNNPGNLEFGQFAKDHGAIGVNNNFAVFPDMKTGENAQVARLKTKMYQSQSIAGAIEQYAPKEAHNDPVKYIEAVTKWTGMSAEKKLSSMTPRDLIVLSELSGAMRGRLPALNTSRQKTWVVLLFLPPMKLQSLRRLAVP